ncbi:hypothetical protein [Aequorivita sp. KMM 9714]|uniref:hypothetical protein n=1 Tax=Aequorivita sp. KMM 9714 TaxID=2707173 RepID=UPI0013E9F57D|nr:hypothetical protein [Aequorivita sp. KMM 9714]NGX85385.1 hypothetical protein [Aequorivita sp. KMM 9714]
MNKLLLLILILFSMTMFAQKEHNIKNSIRVNSIALLSNYYEFQYERVLNNKNSIKIGFGNGFFLKKTGNDADKDFESAFGSNIFNNNNEHIVKGFSLNADYRYFFSAKPAPKGIYISPGIQYLKLNEKYTYVTFEEGQLRTLIDNNYSILNFRFLLGYQFIITKNILINPYLGVGVALSKVENPTNTVEGYGKGLSLNMGVDVGIAF